MNPDEGATTGHCPECGAPATDGLACRERFEWLLAWEGDDPELRSVHFLLVASYNLQHPAQFTDVAIDGLRSTFIDYLDNGTPVQEVRLRVGKAAAGSTRVLREEHERRPVLRRWTMTTADVYDGGRPTGAAQRVQRWAASIRHEL